MPNCQRCRKQTDITTMSMFNTQMICHECDLTERKHPKFEDARQAENDAISRGEYNFPGIGLPADLM